MCLVTLLLSSLAHARALPTSPSSPLFARLGGDCDGYSWNDGSSDASPWYSDCEQIMTNIEGGGQWTITGTGYGTLVSYGTCAFGVQNSDADETFVESGDIINLIYCSILAYNWEGRVGAWGYMNCAGYHLYWSLY